MGIRFDRPFFTLTTADQNQKAKDLWEGESLGGIKENNNMVPPPLAVLLGLVIVTCFMLTFPLWGQRPTAALYVDAVDLLDSTEVQKILDNKDMPAVIADEQAMAVITKRLQAFESVYDFQREQHPITMDQLRYLAPKIKKLRDAGVDLEEYSVIGANIIKANFAGNARPDGTIIRKQPWWDVGYTIDVFYVIYFCIAVFLMVKGLPPSTWQPDHAKSH